MTNVRSSKLYLNTPLIRSIPLSRKVGAEVWLKLEAVQPSGSFKLRGMGYKACIEKENGAEKFISSSGGNAGLAVAYAGMTLNVPVSVYVPHSTDIRTIRKLEQFDARVVVTGQHWAETHQQAMLGLGHPGTVYFHPFDDPLVWQGNATLIGEVVRSGIRPDMVVCSVGGGGLFCGIKQGLQQHGLDERKIVTVETTGADALYQSRVQNRHVTLPGITSKASSLGAVKVCNQAYAYLCHRAVQCETVTDEEARMACDRFLEDHRIKVELACGAALAVLYENRQGLFEGMKNIVVVVCGGVNQ